MTKKELKDYCLSMANTIQKSLFCSITPAMFCSWGVSKRTATFYNEMPALLLRVNGLQYKGDILIAYNEGTDYFECYFLDKKMTVLSSLKDISFDELGIILDERIEKPRDMTEAEYSNKCKLEMNKAS